MSRAVKRGLFVTGVLGVAVTLAAYGVLSLRGSAATAQVIRDAGKFRVGAALGEERAGFSGRTQVLVFAAGEDAAALEACLKSAAVEAQMDFFTGILVDENTEPDVEVTLRERDGLRVVVRGMQGQLLGSLGAGYTCDDLTALLERVRAASTRHPEKSPVYAALKDSTAPIDDLLAKGAVAEANKLAGFLEELEGPQSTAVLAVNSKLGK